MRRGAFLSTLAALAIVGSLAARPVPELEARLTALTPGDAMAYFELGEEVAFDARTADERALARRLYLLAYEMDRADAGTLGRSVCLALAEIAATDQDRDLLLALARAFGGEGAPAVAAEAPSRTADDENAFALATALGHYRAGEYDRAAAILGRPEVAALLERHESLLGSASVLIRDVNSKPSCRECRNQRVVKADLDPREEWRLCYTCGGDPGPGLDLRGLVAQLRVESILLSGSRRSWSAQVVADGGAPLREVDPEDLASMFGVDASRPVWRAGKWLEVEAAGAEGDAPGGGEAP